MGTRLTPDPVGTLSADSIVTRRAAIDALVARCAPPRGKDLRDRIRACIAYAIREERLTVRAGDMVRLGDAARALLGNRNVGGYKPIWVTSPTRLSET